MPPQVSDQDLGDAFLQSVQHGSFPQSEHVVSAPVPSTALPHLLDVVRKARDDTTNEIRQVSREAASDVDGWIFQARKLQDDIKRSQDTAKAIVQEAESGKENTTRVQNAATQLSFMYSEIAYNESLVQVIEQLRDISTLLESVQDAAVHGHILHALDRLEDTNAAFHRLGPFESTRIVGVLKSRADQLRSAIIENITESWNALILVEPAERKVTMKEAIERESPVHIESVVEALNKLNLLDKFLSRLSRDVDAVIVGPRLTFDHDQIVFALEIGGDSIQIMGRITDMSVKASLEDIHVIAEYLSTRLPPSIAVPLSEKLVPSITARLITNWLLPAIPLSTDGVHDFQENLSLVLGLAEYFDELDWSGQKRLQDWVDKSAEIWLAKRKEAAIARVQRLLPRRVCEKTSVERVETQMISKGDAMLAGEGNKEDQDEDWGADWGDDEKHPAEEHEASYTQAAEEEDMSAWGMDDDEDTQGDTTQNTKPDNDKELDEVDPDAWGWGDDEEAKPTAPTEPAQKPVAPTKANGNANAPHKSAQEKAVTLRETYTVTAIPDSLMEIIVQVVKDVATLNSPELVGSVIAPASGGLYAIPSLLLAMYRATAAMHYSKDVAGNMLIYNDCTRLSDRLRSFIVEQAGKDKTSNLPQHLRPSVRLRLDNDIKSVEGFAKRAYGREMENQRTIIRDLLDGAQGFQSCTIAPFATECDNAVAMTIDRIEEVKRQWQKVLSHSVLLQSLGSLVSTALTKFITEVEDMPDIAEEESKKLHGYGISLSSISTLFQTDDAAGDARDMTGIYTPNWFKFQYLSEILDSSLADIRYMWTDSELKLEMEADEVIDLINALAELGRYGLSTLVNNLLRPEQKPIPFNILINGQFLRSTLQQFLTQHDLSSESTLDVEYTPALLPPLNVSSFEHDDWVSAVDVLSAASPAGGSSIASGQERILSASYDGLVRVWNTSGDVLATSSAPNNGGRITCLKTARWLSDKKFVAAGLDSVVRVYKYDEDTRSITPSVELYSHNMGVEDVAVHRPSNRILSASSDTTIALFSSSTKDNPAAPAPLLPTSTAASAKRQKLSKPERSVPARGALATLSGHASPASAVIFKPADPTVAYSTSHDHTLKTWDLPTATCVDTRTTGHALLALAALPHLHLLAAGTSARHITLIDPRASATQISVITLRGHKNAVVALDADPGSHYRLLSGSHDGTAQIWDVRNVRPSVGMAEGQVGESVYTIARESVGGGAAAGGAGAAKMHAHGEGVKVLGVRWDRDVGILSAGEDRRVQVNRAAAS
ncbi:hypothetical protein BDV95DRAFT_674235 [Massariosphaeria phaeospora]|uniref:Ribosome biogenesis protein YTM1 n=1 Tax=Massariosphaeria phaeospora TaxID=100035 RepID=A0A7C8IFS7_9PLEO|nr:hypothetical protein BDV95DRAFT_674235 [Massariosphaeria phaeospora]